jgi:hypothetical protein
MPFELPRFPTPLTPWSHHRRQDDGDPPRQAPRGLRQQPEQGLEAMPTSRSSRSRS